jgi:hypothetical protein
VEVLEEAGGHACLQGEGVLDLGLEEWREGRGGGEDEEDVPALEGVC